MSSHHMNRRELLRSGALGAGAFYLAPGLLSSDLRAGGRRSEASDNVLVVIQLGGGNDGLNTVVPFGMDDYHRRRNTLRIREQQCIPITRMLGFNPFLQRFKVLYDEGRLAVVHGVGYSKPNRSHFQSMDIWHTADPSARTKTSGWLGRTADLCCIEQPDPDFTINIARETPLALLGTSSRPVSFVDPNAYRFQGSRQLLPSFERMTAGGDGSDDVLDLLSDSARDARVTSGAIRTQIADYRTPVEYPATRLGAALRRVAALIASDLSTRIYYVYHNGFDTHANQLVRQNRLLGELDAAAGAFQMDLSRGVSGDRVTTMMFSEFGRRVSENASRGTDHGTAGPVFVLGDKVKGGLHGMHPDLRDLDQGDMNHTTDFRSVYTSILESWMGVDAAAVLGGRFAPVDLY